MPSRQPTPILWSWPPLSVTTVMSCDCSEMARADRVIEINDDDGVVRFLLMQHVDHARAHRWLATLSSIAPLVSWDIARRNSGVHMSGQAGGENDRPWSPQNTGSSRVRISAPHPEGLEPIADLSPLFNGPALAPRRCLSESQTLNDQRLSTPTPLVITHTPRSMVNWLP